mmetsp:Transcript_82515/g.246053  ORF Transcript_82515/g.246053 Transcript_82515/m.246053 type:complete len:216 (+) Transcript_82515:488-1135(+)
MQNRSSSMPDGALRNVRAGVVGDPTELPENGDCPCAESPVGTWRKFPLTDTCRALGLPLAASAGFFHLLGVLVGLLPPPLRMASFKSRRHIVPSLDLSMARKISLRSLVSSGPSSCASNCNTARRTLEASAYRCRDRRASRDNTAMWPVVAPRASHGCRSASCALIRCWGSLLRSFFRKSIALSDTGFQRLLWLQSACPAFIFAIISFSSPWNGG